MNKRLLLSLAGILSCVLGVGLMFSARDPASFVGLRNVSWGFVTFGAALTTYTAFFFKERDRRAATPERRK